MNTALNSVSTGIKKRDKTRFNLSGVNSMLFIHNYLLEYRITFKSFLALLLITDRFNKKGCSSTYTWVYDQIHSERNGASKKVLIKSINRLGDLGLLRVDNSGYPSKLYPTERALKEVSKFL